MLDLELDRLIDGGAANNETVGDVSGGPEGRRILALYQALRLAPEDLEAPDLRPHVMAHLPVATQSAPVVPLPHRPAAEPLRVRLRGWWSSLVSGPRGSGLALGGLVAALALIVWLGGGLPGAGALPGAVTTGPASFVLVAAGVVGALGVVLWLRLRR